MKISRRDFIKLSAVQTTLLASNSALAAKLPAPELNYLQGPYTPVKREFSKAPVTLVSGAIPQDLKGSFLQNSTNPQFPESFNRYHWFDGDGMYHVIHFGGDGNIDKTYYSNRFVRTEKFLEEQKLGHGKYKGVLDLGKMDGIAYYLESKAPGENASNTSFMQFNDRLFTLWWMGGNPYEIDIENLKTVGKTNLHGALSEGEGFPAHPKIDPVTKEMIFFTNVITNRTLNVGIMTPDYKFRGVTFTLDEKTFFHDMGITENYIIVYICPTVMRLMDGGGMKFDQTMPTKFLVIDRKTLKHTYFYGKPSFISHTVNCWEENGQIKIVGVRAPHPVTPLDEVSRTLNLPLDQFPHNGGTNFVAEFYQWNLNLSKPHSLVEEYQLSPEWEEFPTIDPDKVGRFTRYAYALRIKHSGRLTANGIIKHDLLDPRLDQVFNMPEGACCGELQFVRKNKMISQNNENQDDNGYLVHIVYDNGHGKSEVWVYDAKDITQGPICRLGLPGRVTPGAHTTWVKA